LVSNWENHNEQSKGFSAGNGGREAMKKHTIQTTVGIFVIIGLLVVGYMIVKLGEISTIGDDSYSLFARFSSVSGLRVGSVVEMMGIKIGEVEQLTLDQKEKAAVVELTIDKGIKVLEDATATIMTAGLIGEKIVQIEAGNYGEVLQPGATITETESAVEKLPLDKLVNQTLLATEGVNRLVRSPELMEAIRSLGETMKVARKLVRNVDKRVVPLASSIQVTVRHAQELVRNFDDQIVPLAANIEDTSTAVLAAFEQAENTFSSLQHSAEGNSVLGYVLIETLSELSNTARSIRALTDYLERHPEALVFGKR
jgi:phospholipid/cholesterol/gamma-HCH transport system substrate-binding protein